MASFHIHEDCESGENGENVQPASLNPPMMMHPKTKRNDMPRIALQQITGRPMMDGSKRQKLGDQRKSTSDQEKLRLLESHSTKQRTNHQPANEEDGLDDFASCVNPFKVGGDAQAVRLVPNQRLEHEYEEDILQHLLGAEKWTKIKPNYMTKQVHLNWKMRSILIDWLANVGDNYNMDDQTLHLAVTYLDKFLSYISVIREKFQLVGATTMMLAGKVEEIYPPTAKEWAFLTGDTYTTRQVLKMELLLIKILHFNMQPPTILDFIRLLCSRHRLDAKTMHLSMYLSELVLLEGRDYLEHVPSKLAASSVALARHTLSKQEPWTKKMEASIGYTMKQLSPVVQKQQKSFKGSPFSEHQAIRNKYQSEKYNRVALLKPKMLNLDEMEDGQ